VVAIRDGKLATETVRSTRVVAAAADAGGEGEPGSGESQERTLEEIMQEVTVLDSAGRLQIPKDYLQRSNIKSRVTLEVLEDGILIRPAGDVGHVASAEALGAALAANTRSNRYKKVTNKLLDRLMSAVNRNRKTEG